MALKSYIITTECKAPIVRATGRPDKPQQIDFKVFRRGEIVKGELKHANNEPAFILVGGVCVVPVNCAKELITKEVVSNIGGDDKINVPKAIAPSKNQKVKYIDAFVVGGIFGVLSVILAEKQGWIQPVDKKNKIYGAVIGALAGTYLAYRIKQNTNTKKAE